MSRWLTTFDDRDDVHVVPLDDLTDHPLTEDCVCGPLTEPVPGEDGSIGWLHVHHSLDGREANEDQTAPPDKEP